MRGGYNTRNFADVGYGGSYLSSTVRSDTNIRIMAFSYEGIDTVFNRSVRFSGFSLRWLVYRGDKAAERKAVVPGVVILRS